MIEPYRLGRHRLLGAAVLAPTHRLQEWKDQTDQPSASDTMAAISHRLSQQDIVPAADYYAAMRADVRSASK
jgi:cytochrome c553